MYRFGGFFGVAFLVGLALFGPPRSRVAAWLGAAVLLFLQIGWILMINGYLDDM